MRLENSVRFLCAAAVLAMASWHVQAQGQTPAKAEPPTVPDMVAVAYRVGDFTELERLYSIYGKPGVRSELTGTPRVEDFWEGISQGGNPGVGVTDAYYQQLEAQAKRWTNEHPQSVMAQLLYVQTLQWHAWAYRGDGYANTVSPAGWAGFKNYLNLAADQLRRTQSLAVNDSSWNDFMLNVGRGLDWDRDKLMAVFENGIAKNPDHDGLYFTMQAVLLPKWGGDLETVDRFIEKVAKDTKAKRGLEMYARLYADLSYSEVKKALFTGTRASWPSMKTGFEDLLKRYPHSYRRNIYAYFACMANDRPALQEQIALIGDNFASQFWGDTPERTFDTCKAMTQQL